MSINEHRMREILKLFAFPRLSGTIYEKKAFTLAKEKIEEMDLKPEIQSFKFSTFYSRIYPKLAFPLIFWTFLALFLNINLLFVITNLFFTFLVLFPLFIITRTPENIRFGNVLESQNLYVNINSISSEDLNDSQDTEKTNVFFIAHLDSKGQRITVRTRGLSIFFWTISFISNSLILFLRTVLSIFIPSFYLLFTIIGIIPMTINFVATVILSSNTTNNKSKGIVDNASGIVCVLELLNYFSGIPNDISNCTLWFVLTGAEESGTMGIRYFYKLLNDVNQTTSIVNNFESLGKSVNIIMSKSNLKNNLGYYNFLEKKAKEHNFNTYINPLSRGIHTDGIYLSRKNFNLFEFGSTEVGKFMHSEHDTLENVDITLLKKLCEFIISTLGYFQNHE